MIRYLSARLLRKTLVLIVLLFGLIATTVSIYSGWSVHTSLTKEYNSKGLAIAKGIAESSVELLLYRDASTIQSLVDKYLEIEGVSYVFVVNGAHEIVVHTFSPEVPPEIMKEAQATFLTDLSDHMASFMKFQNGSYMDISAPILNGSMGYVHVGMDRSLIDAHITESIVHQQILIFFIFLLSIIIAYFAVRKISEPLTHLTGYANQLAIHDFSSSLLAPEQTAALTTRTKDEIGDLAQAFVYLEQMLIGYIRNLKDTHKKLEIAKNKAEEANRLKSQFLANTSHELRTPLNGIIGIVSNILDGTDGPIDPPLRRHLEMVKSCGVNLKDLVNNILDFSKLESGKADFVIQEFDLTDVLEDIKGIGDGLIADKKEVILETNWGELPKVWGDKQKIRQVLINLLGNAVKFTLKGYVKLEIKPAPDSSKYPPSLLVAISDSGIGISKENQAVIFEEFRQADGDASRDFEGTGLGLAITKKIVAAHQSQLWVESEPGSGSTFFFTIPIQRFESEQGHTVHTEANDLNSQTSYPAEEDPLVETPESEAAVSVPISQEINETPTLVMVVDDYKINIEVVSMLLEKKGYEVVSALSAYEALEKLNECKPDLFILDVMMPKMDGLNLCKTIKSMNEFKYTPVIMLSAKFSPADKAAGLDIGAADYVGKPYDDKDLIARVQNLVKKSKIEHSLQNEVEKVKALSHESLSEGSAPQAPRTPMRKLVKGNGEKVLVADDHPFNVEVVKTLLESHHYQVFEAVDGIDALEKIKEFKPDILLLDLMMPRMGGYEVTKVLKTDPEYEAFSDLPIIILTAKSSRDDKVYGLNMGADDYLGKPFDNLELVARVNALLRIKTLKDHLKNWNKELEDQIEIRTKEIESIQEQLVKTEKIAGITNLVITVNHELNSPLMSVLMGAQKLAKLDLDAKGKKYADMVIKSSMKIREIVYGLREITDPLEVEYTPGVKMIQLKPTATPEEGGDAEA